MQRSQAVKRHWAGRIRLALVATIAGRISTLCSRLCCDENVGLFERHDSCDICAAGVYVSCIICIWVTAA